MDRVYWKKNAQRGLAWLVNRELVEKNGPQYRLNLEKSGLGIAEASFLQLYSEYLEYLLLDGKVEPTLHDAGSSTVSFVWSGVAPKSSSSLPASEIRQLRSRLRRLLAADPAVVEKLTRVLLEEAGRADPGHQLRSVLVWSKDLQSEVMRDVNGRFERQRKPPRF